MASIQALSQLADSGTSVMTSLPLSAGTPAGAQFQCVPQGAGGSYYDPQGSQSQSTMYGYGQYGQTTGRYGLPTTYWQSQRHGRWNVSGYASTTAGDQHPGWSTYPTSYQQAQQYINGYSLHRHAAGSSSWCHGRSASRYHPYAIASADISSRTDQRLPYYVAQTYSDSPGDASDNVIHQAAAAAAAYNARQPPCDVSYQQNPPPDYTISTAYCDYSEYQNIASPNNLLDDFAAL